MKKNNPTRNIRQAVVAVAKTTSGRGTILLSSIGWGLLGSYVAVMTWGCDRNINAMASGMDDAQIDKFRRIIRERKSLTLWAMIVSLVPALAVLSWCKSSIGIALFLWLGLTMIIYLVWPKSMYMLDSLIDPSQASQWMSICICMRTRSIIGFITGMVAYIVIVALTRPILSKPPLSTCDIIID